jgi:hypothetical protein
MNTIDQKDVKEKLVPSTLQVDGFNYTVNKTTDDAAYYVCKFRRSANCKATYRLNRMTSQGTKKGAHCCCMACEGRVSFARGLIGITLLYPPFGTIGAPTTAIIIIIMTSCMFK